MKILKFKKQSKDKYMLYLDDNSKITLYEDVIIKNNFSFFNSKKNKLFISCYYLYLAIIDFYNFIK